MKELLLSVRQIVDERDVINAWRKLFRENGATQDTLEAAGALLSNLSGESPLYFRLANELEELKKGPPRRRKPNSAQRTV